MKKDECGDYDTDGKVIDLCRISMERPEYITGFNETFKLTEDQKCKMIEVLNKPVADTGMCLWQYMFESMNAARKYTKRLPKLEVLAMPNYSKL